MNESEKFSGNHASSTSVRNIVFFPDMSTHVQTDVRDDMRNVSGHVEIRPDKARFTLTVDEVSERFAQAGVPRSPKTITRWCKLGHLEYTEADTEKNFKFLIDPQSVERRIIEVQQTKSVRKDDADMSTHVETKNKTENNVSDHVQTHEEFGPDMSRQNEHEPTRETLSQTNIIYLDERERELYERMIKDRDGRIVALEKDKDELRDQIREERTLHKSQIELLASSDKESKSLTQSITNLLGMIWPGSKPNAGELPTHYGPIIRDVTNGDQR